MYPLYSVKFVETAFYIFSGYSRLRDFVDMFWEFQVVPPKVAWKLGVERKTNRGQLLNFMKSTPGVDFLNPFTLFFKLLRFTLSFYVSKRGE